MNKNQKYTTFGIFKDKDYAIAYPDKRGVDTIESLNKWESANSGVREVIVTKSKKIANTVAQSL